MEAAAPPVLEVKRHDAVTDVSPDSAASYEKHAQRFLQSRDASSVGIQSTRRWAQSLAPGAEVMEIACGGGVPVTKTLVEAGLKVWAIDASPGLVSVFRDRFPDIPVKCETVLESDYFERKYDAAISIGLIFLLGETDQIQMLKRVSEILHPGASFLFTAPVQTGTWTDVITGHPSISLGQKAYESALAQSGFRVIDRFEDSGPNHYFETEKIADPAPGDAA